MAIGSNALLNINPQSFPLQLVNPKPLKQLNCMITPANRERAMDSRLPIIVNKEKRTRRMHVYR